MSMPEGFRDQSVCVVGLGYVGLTLATVMADVGFDELDAPIVRVGAPFMPVPFARSLEQAYLPNAEKAVAAVRRVLE